MFGSLTNTARLALVLMLLGLALVVFERINGAVMGSLKDKIPFARG
jgi:hypothetical protein